MLNASIRPSRALSSFVISSLSSVRRMPTHSLSPPTGTPWWMLQRRFGVGTHLMNAVTNESDISSTKTLTRIVGPYSSKWRLFSTVSGKIGSQTKNCSISCLSISSSSDSPLSDKRLRKLKTHSSNSAPYASKSVSMYLACLLNMNGGSLLTFSKNESRGMKKPNACSEKDSRDFLNQEEAALTGGPQCSSCEAERGGTGVALAAAVDENALGVTVERLKAALLLAPGKQNVDDVAG
mmetsp:Transcript_12006/g.29115  ORF Transcript_12006/g.29115 Transcript_12006/m.29115 type:complete len:237 (-) Transcript_12006:3048-3758(-)